MIVNVWFHATDLSVMWKDVHDGVHPHNPSASTNACVDVSLVEIVGLLRLITKLCQLMIDDVN